MYNKNSNDRYKYTIVPDDDALVIEDNKEPTVYASYEIGQEVTIAGEPFYVIQKSDEKKSKITVLAKYNLSHGINTKRTI